MVKAKKHLGQHFLRDENAAHEIVNLLKAKNGDKVLEIGPGTGVLTKYLLAKTGVDLHVVEMDRESVRYLEDHYPNLDGRIHSGDFLKMNFADIGTPLSIVGNFPYNISSQILFKVWEHHNDVPELVGMFQKEVAQRVAMTPGNKSYGILSVLLQAFYDIEYCMTIPPEVFDPPPKVDSGVIRMTRNRREALPLSKSFFKTVVKTAFNQRRKTLRNGLKSMVNAGNELPQEYASKRPEQLDVEEFITIAVWLKNQ